MINAIFFYCLGFGTCFFGLFILSLFKGIDKKEEDIKDLQTLNEQNKAKRGL